MIFFHFMMINNWYKHFKSLLGKEDGGSSEDEVQSTVKIILHLETLQKLGNRAHLLDYILLELSNQSFQISYLNSDWRTNQESEHI